MPCDCAGTELDLEETQRVFWTSISGEVMPDPFTSTTPGSAGMSSWSSKTSASDLPSEPISFTVVCTPQLISGGDRFFTELEFHFRKRAAGMGGGIRAMCSVKVEAHVWGIQSSLEPWMMAEVKKNLTEFFPFMSEFFHMNSKAAMTPAVLEPEGVTSSLTLCLFCTCAVYWLRFFATQKVEVSTGLVCLLQYSIVYSVRSRTIAIFKDLSGCWSSPCTCVCYSVWYTMC